MKLICPFCGSENVSRTYKGYAESIAKDTSTYVVGGTVTAITHAVPYIGKALGHGAWHITEEIIKNNSCEYICSSCNKVFHYSSGGGAKK